MDLKNQIKLAKSTKHMHSTWYRETYPEVAKLGLDPATHFILYGAAMGRNPGKHFNTQFYLDAYPEVRKSKLNPLVHYALHGQQAGYATRPKREEPRKKINLIRTKLLSLGFTERPLAELTEIAETSDNPEARAMAARELALWHMRAKTETDYRTALDWIARARPNAPDIDFRSKLSTIELLCHYHLNDYAAGLAAYDRAALAGEATPDLTLARVNYEQTPENRVRWINQVLARYGIEPVTLLPDEGQPAYDRLTCAVDLLKVTDGPKVTVLIAAYDAAETLPAALRSLQDQTWQNLEIIVLDDCSPKPDTVRVAEAFAAHDPRIQVVRMEKNGGAYVARNHGLDMATGEFVTLHDADDWSHPRKIETQVRFMIENPEVMGCTSEQARSTAALEFCWLRPNNGFVTKNVSSLLLRRKLMTDELGYWDTVRFGADAEIMNRIKSIFGKNSIQRVQAGPLSFQRQSSGSSTSNVVTGIDVAFFGARKAYDDAQKYHHKLGKNLKYTNSEFARPFIVPDIMCRAESSRGKAEHFNTVIFGEFRHLDDETKQLVQEIKELKARGKKIALVECHRYTAPMPDGISAMCDEVRAQVDGVQVKLLVYGESASCDRQIFHRTKLEGQRYLPRIESLKIERKTEKTENTPVPQKKSALPKLHPLEHLRLGISYDESTLKSEYVNSSISDVPDEFVLYRIIGNDLVPRHAKGQSRENLRFVLENEPLLDRCTRLWIVNRIFDPNEKEKIIQLLDSHGQDYIDIPFDHEEYRAIGWDFEAMPTPGFLASREFQNLEPLQKDRVRTALYRLKNLYVMNNNGARNVALRAGRARAKWVLPWDGNCFVTQRAWIDITGAVLAQPYLKYFAVPMQRMSDNGLLLSEDFCPDPLEEPQLIFRSDASEEFLESFPYGRRPKVELFWRLGITGPWDRWQDDTWEQQRRGTSQDAGAYGVAGWVARMFSGMKSLEQQGDKKSFKNRGLQRQEAIIAAIDHVDTLIHLSNTKELAFYNASVLEDFSLAGSNQNNKVIETLVKNAEAALSDGPFSVVQKTTLPPSGNINDYWHPAPYWWPNPAKPNGLPYIRKDGQRVPGTRMYELESEKYDRTRLQKMFDNTTTLALAWKLTGRKDFAEHGAELIRAWFLDPKTRMEPHLTYAQVRLGHNKNKGVATGVIEFKDFYYTLDAIRLLEESGAFSLADVVQLKDWLSKYLFWLETSDQGLRECRSINNHGTYYDLQTAAICAYLGEHDKLRDILFRAQSRLAQQITEDGEQPDEMKRSITQHYVFFNLQGLLNIFRIAKAKGFPPINYTVEPGRRLKAAFKWILNYDQQNWPYEQIDVFDCDRTWPLIKSALDIGLVSVSELTETYQTNSMTMIKPIFDPHHAVNPYWNLTVDTPSHAAPDEYSQAQGESAREGAAPVKPFAERLDEVAGINVASEAQKPLLRKQQAELVREAIQQQKLTEKQLYIVLEICVQLNEFDAGLAVLQTNRECLKQADYEKYDFALKVLSGRAFEHQDLRALQGAAWWHQDGKVLGRDLVLLKAMAAEGELVKGARALLDYVIHGGDVEALVGNIEVVLRARGEPLEHVDYYLDMVHHLRRCSGDKTWKNNSIRLLLPAIENIDLCFVGGFGWSGSGAAFDMLREARSDKLVFETRELNIFESQFGMVKVLSARDISDTAVAHFWLDAVFGFPCAPKGNQLQKFFARSLPAAIAYNKEGLKKISVLFQTINPLAGFDGAEAFTRMGFDFIAGCYAIIQPGCEKVIFNNCIHGRNAFLVASGGKNARLLGVTRDVRDAYVSRIYDKSSPSTPEVYTKIRSSYAKKYANFEAVRCACERVEEVAFEDLVTDQGARQRVVDFFGIGDIDFIPRTKFFPEDSKKNIGIYQQHVTFDLSKV